MLDQELPDTSSDLYAADVPDTSSAPEAVNMPLSPLQAQPTTPTPAPAFEESIPDISSARPVLDVKNIQPLGSTQSSVERPIEDQVGNPTLAPNSASTGLSGDNVSKFDSLLTMSYGKAPEPTKVKPTYKSELAQIVADNPDILEEAGINTPARLHMFLATLGHESNFKAVREGLSKYASSQSEFPGMGVGQVTGRANWKAVGDLMGVDFVNNKQLMLDPVLGFKAAVTFWKMNNLNRFADSNNYHGLGLAYNGPAMTDYARREQYLRKVQAAAPNATNAAELIDLLAAPGKSTPDLIPASGTEYLATRAAAARLPISTRQLMSDSFNADYESTIAGRSYVINQVSNQYVDKINEVTGGNYKLNNDSFYEERVAGALPFSNHMDKQGEDFMALLAQVKQDHPEVLLPVQDFREVIDTAGKIIKSRHIKANDNTDRDTTWGQDLAGFAASVGGWMADPFNSAVSIGSGVALGVATGGTSLLAQAGIGAGSMLLTSAARQPINQEQLAALGEKHGLGQAISGVASDTISGAVGGVVGAVASRVGSMAIGGVKGLYNKIFKGEWAPVRAELKARGATEEHLQAGDRINTLNENNPLGSSPQAFHDMETRVKSFEQQVNAGKQATILPPEITGLNQKPGIPWDEKFHLEALEELGYADTHKVAKALDLMREARKEAGNATPDEYMKAAIPDTEYHSPLMRQTVEQAEKIQQNIQSRLEARQTGQAFKDIQERARPLQQATQPQEVIPTLEGTQVPAFGATHIEALKVEVPKSKAYLLNNIEVNRAQALGSIRSIEFGRRQAPIFEFKYKELETALREPMDAFDKIGLQMQAKEAFDAFSHAKNDLLNSEELLQRATLRHKEHLEDLKVLDKADNTLTYTEQDIKDVNNLLRDLQQLNTGDYSKVKGLKQETEFFQRMALLDISKDTNIHKQIEIAKTKAEALRAKEISGNANTKEFKQLEQLDKDIAYYTKKVKADAEGNLKFDTRIDQAKRHIQKRIDESPTSVMSKAKDIIDKIQKQTAFDNDIIVTSSDSTGTPLNKWLTSVAEQVSTLQSLTKCIGG